MFRVDDASIAAYSVLKAMLWAIGKHCFLAPGAIASRSAGFDAVVRMSSPQALGIHNNGHQIVTARLLPQRFCFDTSNEFLVVDETVEEVVPVIGRSASVGEHLLQFSHAIVRERGDGLTV